MRHLAAMSLLTVGFLAAAPVPAHAQTADQVIEKHVAAVGGRPALAKLTSRRSTGNVTLSVQGNDLAGSYEASAKGPNKTRVVLKLDTTPVGGPGEMVIDQRFDGVNGIVMNSMQGEAPIGGGQLDNMRNGAFPTPLLTYKERGTKAELLPREKVGNQELIVIQLTPKTGSVSKIYLDPATLLIARTTAKVDVSGQGEIEQIVAFSDYRTVDGVKVAFHTVNTTPVQVVTVKLSNVVHNVAMDDAMFVKK